MMTIKSKINLVAIEVSLLALVTLIFASNAIAQSSRLAPYTINAKVEVTDKFPQGKTYRMECYLYGANSTKELLHGSTGERVFPTASAGQVMPIKLELKPKQPLRDVVTRYKCLLNIIDKNNTMRFGHFKQSAQDHLLDPSSVTLLEGKF